MLAPRAAIRFDAHVSAHTLSTMSFTIGASSHARALTRANVAHPRETRTAFARPVPSRPVTTPRWRETSVARWRNPRRGATHD
jgi:hypothetical protein